MDNALRGGTEKVGVSEAGEVHHLRQYLHLIVRPVACDTIIVGGEQSPVHCGELYGELDVRLLLPLGSRFPENPFTTSTSLPFHPPSPSSGTSRNTPFALEVSASDCNIERRKSSWQLEDTFWYTEKGWRDPYHFWKGDRLETAKVEEGTREMGRYPLANIYKRYCPSRPTDITCCHISSSIHGGTQ